MPLLLFILYYNYTLVYSIQMVDEPLDGHVMVDGASLMFVHTAVCML